MHDVQMPLPQGTHLTADLAGCAANHPWMTQLDTLRQACLDAVQAAELTIVGDRFHAFSPVRAGQPAGITGVVLLAESHLAVHTWPESGVVTLDVFVCHLHQDNGARAQGLLDALIAGFAPARWVSQAIARGIPADINT